MQINITEFFTVADDWEFCGSRATHGNNAAKDTYSNALTAASEFGILKTEEECQAMRDYLKEIGFSEADENHSNEELTALLIQCICLDVRESGQSINSFNWELWENEENSGRLFKGINGQVYYYLGI